MKLSQCEILDTWYTTGLRGTGSNDLVVKDVFVQADHTFSFQDKDLIKRPGPLYAFPFMFAAKTSPVALGIARHALDVLIETATNKTARRYTVGEHLESPKMMRDDVFIQETVGRAETMLTSARAYLFEVMGDLWATLVEGGNPRPRRSPDSPRFIPTSSASAWMWCSSCSRRQAARRSIRRDRLIVVCATS